MISWNFNKTICSIGGNYQSGMYVLFLKIAKPTKVTFGRYKNRKEVKLTEGSYVYHGIALNRNGPNSLGNKIDYNLQRSGKLTNQEIRKKTLHFFDDIDLTFNNNSRGKKLIDDIDRVLDSVNTSVDGILIFRRQHNIEISWNKIFTKMNENSEPQLKDLGIQDSIKNFYGLDQNALKVVQEKDDLSNQYWWISLANYLIQLDSSVNNLITSPV